MVPPSNTISHIYSCPLANASSFAIRVVIHVSPSPKLFAVFVIWRRFRHLTLRISESVSFFRDGPWDQPQSLDAQSSTEEVADVLCTMQRVHEWSKLFFDTSVLSAVDPWWMLAQESCCTSRLVVGRSWSRHRQRAQGRFFDVAQVQVTRKFRQRAASISETTSRRRVSRRLVRKSNTMPQIGNTRL